MITSISESLQEIQLCCTLLEYNYMTRDYSRIGNELIRLMSDLLHGGSRGFLILVELEFEILRR